MLVTVLDTKIAVIPICSPENAHSAKGLHCTVLLQVIRLGKIKYMALNGLLPVGHLSLFLINGKYNWNRLQSLEKNLAQCLSECG